MTTKYSCSAIRLPTPTLDEIEILNSYNMFTTPFPTILLQSHYTSHALEYNHCYCEENVWCLCLYIEKLVFNPMVTFSPLFSHLILPTNQIDAIRTKYKKMIICQFYAFYLSSSRKRILFSQQKSSPVDTMFYWDYHVILLNQFKHYHHISKLSDTHDSLQITADILALIDNYDFALNSTPKYLNFTPKWVVYDFDSRLPFPSPASVYFSESLPKFFDDLVSTSHISKTTRKPQHIPMLQQAAYHSFRLTSLPQYLSYFSSTRAHMINPHTSTPVTISNYPKLRTIGDVFNATPPAYPPIIQSVNDGDNIKCEQCDHIGAIYKQFHLHESSKDDSDNQILDLPLTDLKCNCLMALTKTYWHVDHQIHGKYYLDTQFNTFFKYLLEFLQSAQFSDDKNDENKLSQLYTFSNLPQSLQIMLNNITTIAATKKYGAVLNVIDVMILCSFIHMSPIRHLNIPSQKPPVPTKI